MRRPSHNLRSKVSTRIFAIAFQCALKALERMDDPLDFAPDECLTSVAGHRNDCFSSAKAKHPSRALGTQSPDHRAVIELTYFQGNTCAQIAEITCRPVSTVKTRTFHVRRRLRALLPTT